MSVSPADVRAIVERVCARPEVLDACAKRDLGAVISALRTGGLTQGRIAELTGLPQGRLSEWKTGKREPKAVTTFQQFADGVGLPPAARRALGLDASSGGAAVTAAPADARVSYPGTPEQAVRNVSHLWIADLNDATFIQRGRADPRAWNDASLRWLVDPGQVSHDQPTRGVSIGTADVERFRATVDVFAKLDDKYGGGHARQALIQYLRTDADRMLSGKYTEAVGRELFAAVGEATLLAAWMCYDSAPASALAQGYFVQALALAQAGNDRLLGASILDAMSHQATFMGRFTEAASLARAARAGTGGIATPTLTAHFHAMEARALARLGDAKACEHALSESMREFEQANPDNDPEWIRYFNESELSAEFGHCMRDLGRTGDAIQHAGDCLGVAGEFARSDFFVSIVLADAHLRAGDIEQAINVTLRALTAGEQIRSARCVSYLREFMSHLPTMSSPVIADFREQAAESRLWRIAAQSGSYQWRWPCQVTA
jgi:tetratricopeptide (TPR) repeat protein/transcriptional regulator with XRE-family HTH domain